MSNRCLVARSGLYSSLIEFDKKVSVPAIDEAETEEENGDVGEQLCGTPVLPMALVWAEATLLDGSSSTLSLAAQ